MLRTIAGSVLALAGLGLAATAAPPQLNNVTPHGLQRGLETEVTFHGSGLNGASQLVGLAGATAAPVATPNPEAGSVKFKITVPPSVALGFYPVRIANENGISNPILLAVGQVPVMSETEPNNTFEAAQGVPGLVAVDGQSAGSDVDFFKFPGRKGQQIVIDAQCARIGSGVDPQIRLTTAGRAYLASADDTPGLATDARLVTTLPEDGEYVVEISDTKYQGGGRPVYRLVIGSLPVADEVYPLGGRRGETVGLELRGGTLGERRIAAATLDVPAPGGLFRPLLSAHALGWAGPSDAPMDLELPRPLVVSDWPELREPADPNAAPLRAVAPVVLNGRIDPAGDEDRFVLAVTPGQALRVQVVAAEAGSALDGSLQVLKPDGSSLAAADDTTGPAVPTRAQPLAAGVVSADPSAVVTPPAGVTELTLVMKDLQGRGGPGLPYRIEVEPVTPRFDVVLADAEISVPRGGTKTVAVSLARQGFNGPVTVTATNPPAGLTVRPGTIAEGQPVGVVSFSAAPDAAFGPVELEVVGTGQGPSGPITARAMKLLVLAQQANLPTQTLVQNSLAAAPAPAEPVAIEAPAEPVEIVHALGGPVTLKVARTMGADAALKVTPLPLPPGVTIAEATIAEKAAEGTVQIAVAPEAAVGRMSVGLQAKGKFGEAEHTISVPAVTLEVVRPAAVEVASPQIEVKAGTTVELTGKVVRKGAFNEPVEVQIKGLPAGLKAENVTVAPGTSDFTLKIAADAGAAEAMATSQVAIAFKVGGKDYPPPPPAGVMVKVVK